MKIEFNEAQTSFLKSAIEKMNDSEIKDVVEGKILLKADIEKKINQFLGAMEDVKGIIYKYSHEDGVAPYPDYAPNFSALSEDLKQYFLAVLYHGTID